jgi:hypothetical protein
MSSSSSLSRRFAAVPLRSTPLLYSLLLGAALLAGCGGSSDSGTPVAVVPPTSTTPTTPDPDPAKPTVPTGRWTAGDLHVHTFQSDDTQQIWTLDQVLSRTFDTFGLDWVAISNHLRSSKYDNDGKEIPGGPIPFSLGMAKYEVPRIQALQASGKYSDKTILSSFEWDMPTHDHANIGILTGGAMSAEALKAVNQFEYLFTNRPATMFAPADVAAWDAKDARAYSTHADSLQAIAWLKKNHPDTSYLQLNHPSRNPGKYTAAQLREMNDLAPDIFFSIEGMVGNQMEPNRGGYESDYIPANLPSRVYGGVDYLVAKVGGTWDALLSEGRRIWNVADSDFHFATSLGRNSSGYAPGEYAKTHLWGDIHDAPSLLNALRSGRSFGANGGLIDALDFRVTGTAGNGEMGSELAAKAGEELKITIRFKSPQRNNYEFQLGSGIYANVKPVVDHIDLIAGDVGAREQPGTPGYARDTNPSTRVIKRFTANDWARDAEGYNTVSFTVIASGNQYFRLRGTNLGVNVPGETVAGDPQPDAKIDQPSADHVARFNAINARNYSDLWFYSNPVFVKVAKL